MSGNKQMQMPQRQVEAELVRRREELAQVKAEG
jgi:hypothetical protein